jgi:hypothetical protein
MAGSWARVSDTGGPTGMESLPGHIARPNTH